MKSRIFCLIVLCGVVGWVRADVPGNLLDPWGGTLPPPLPLPFTPVVPPNPNLKWGTIAIVPTKPDVTYAEAASLGRLAAKQYRRQWVWPRLTIFVIQDQKTVRAFGDYQARRRGAPLKTADLRHLTAIWAKTQACYQYSKGKEWVAYPAKNPRGWWKKLWPA